jgi:hypothetical protein
MVLAAAIETPIHMAIEPIGVWIINMTHDWLPGSPTLFSAVYENGQAYLMIAFHGLHFGQ